MSVHGKEFLEEVGDCQLLKKASVSCSFLIMGQYSVAVQSEEREIHSQR
jgi:hypothetical protein